jgi:hypothetical protein
MRQLQRVVRTNSTPPDNSGSRLDRTVGTDNRPKGVFSSPKKGEKVLYHVLVLFGK